MYFRITLLTAILVLFTACASTASQNMPAEQAGNFVDATAAVEPDPAATESTDEEPVEKVSSATTQQDWICRRERLTGTHYMVKICRPRYEIDEDMRRTQENMRAAQRSAANSGPAR